ncbi:MAG: hypothetical protein K0R68_2982 [Mycobacterium sp.]|jgi:hypothetical protein|nr:hypothetical protein [Mycobacterium sp.]
MTNNTKWAVTVHRKNGDKSNDVLHIVDSAQAAIEAVATNLDLEVDEAGNVAGDDEISRLTVKAAPDAQERKKLWCPTADSPVSLVCHD